MNQHITIETKVELDGPLGLHGPSVLRTQGPNPTRGEFVPDYYSNIKIHIIYYVLTVHIITCVPKHTRVLTKVTLVK